MNPRLNSLLKKIGTTTISYKVEKGVGTIWKNEE